MVQVKENSVKYVKQTLLFATYAKYVIIMC